MGLGLAIKCQKPGRESDRKREALHPQHANSHTSRNFLKKFQEVCNWSRASKSRMLQKGWNKVGIGFFEASKGEVGLCWARVGLRRLSQGSERLIPPRIWPPGGQAGLSLVRFQPGKEGTCRLKKAGIRRGLGCRSIEGVVGPCWEYVGLSWASEIVLKANPL